MKKSTELASHETLYDSIKWIAFGFFAVVYFNLKDNRGLFAIIFIILFILVLFIINIFKQRGLEKIDKIYKK